MKQDKETIRGYFETGDKPTQEQYHDTWDSFWHKDEEIPSENFGTPNLQQVTDEGATTANNVSLQGELTVGDSAESIINTAAGSIEDDGVALHLNHNSIVKNGNEVTSFAGAWDPKTNTPTLADTDANVKGVEYYVSDTSNIDLGAGNIFFEEGDIIANNGTNWYKKVDNNQSVAGGSFVTSTITGEPAGSDQIFNVVSLTQAEYDAGTPVATTLYNITDA